MQKHACISPSTSRGLYRYQRAGIKPNFKVYLDWDSYTYISSGTFHLCLWEILSIITNLIIRDNRKCIPHILRLSQDSTVPSIQYVMNPCVTNMYVLHNNWLAFPSWRKLKARASSTPSVLVKPRFYPPIQTYN